MTWIPEEFLAKATQAFSDAQFPAYGQLATVSKDGKPHVRTVHFHFLHEKNMLAFNSHVHSQKWNEIYHQSEVGICYVDDRFHVQWRAQAKAKALEGDSTLKKKMWMTLRKEVRLTYWEDIDPSRKNPPLEEPTSTFGTILCTPFVWDLYEINDKNYRDGKRTLYVLEGAGWVSKSVSLLHGD